MSRGLMPAMDRCRGPGSPSRSCGLSLLELLIALCLGLILSLAMVALFLDSRLSEASRSEFAGMQENGAFALNLLRRELAQAGFVAGVGGGSAGSTAIARDCAVDNWALDIRVPVDLIDDFQPGLTTATGTRWRCLDGAGVLPGTDLFSVKRSAGSPTLGGDPIRPQVGVAEETQWYLRQREHGGERSWLYVDADGNFPAADRRPAAGVEFWEFYARIFYIRRYSREKGDGIPTLCVEQLAGNGMATDCLVEGVEDMQIEFGIDTDGDGIPDRFRAAPAAAELERAVTARVYLLLRSINPLSGYSDVRRYRLGEKSVPPRGDSFYRRVVSTTVWLRNLRLPRMD